MCLSHMCFTNSHARMMAVEYSHISVGPGHSIAVEYTRGLTAVMPRINPTAGTKVSATLVAENEHHAASLPTTQDAKRLTNTTIKTPHWYLHMIFLCCFATQGETEDQIRSVGLRYLISHFSMRDHANMTMTLTIGHKSESRPVQSSNRSCSHDSGSHCSSAGASMKVGRGPICAHRIKMTSSQVFIYEYITPSRTAVAGIGRCREDVAIS